MEELISLYRKNEFVAANVYFVAFVKGMTFFWRELLPVDGCAIGAALIIEHIIAVFIFDESLVARCQCVLV